MHVMQRLSGLVKERKADVQPSLRASLAVLMNLTHSNPGGAQLVSDCGLCESTADLLEMVCRPNGKGSIDPGIERQRLVEAMEVLSISLGLLINLVEGQPANKPRLAKWHGGVLELLADVITLTGKHDAK